MKFFLMLLFIISLYAQESKNLNFPGSNPIELNISDEVDKLKKIGISLTSDYKTLFFTAELRGNYAVWYSQLNKGVWSKIKKTSFSNGKFDGYSTFNLEENVIVWGTLKNDKLILKYAEMDGVNFNNKKDVHSFTNGAESFPNIVKSNRIYFGRRGKGIFYTEIINGKYCKPKSLRSELNKKFRIGHFCVDKLERFIIFEAKDKNGFGGYDLMILYNEGNGNWSKPKNLGRKINSKYNETHPSLTQDGKYLFFRCSKNKKKSYWVNISDEI